MEVKSMCCLKTLTKLPMAAVGLIDLVACGADKGVCKLAKRGEKAVKRMKKEKECHCEKTDDIPCTNP